jgi:hypothetical protein
MNPFSYGGVVSGKYFFNRTKEISQLKRDLINGHNIILYAPRKYGKTSLIKRVLEELERENFNTIYIDFFNVIDKNKFTEIYAKKLLQKRKHSIETVIKSFTKFVKNITPSVKFDSLGNAVFELNIKESDTNSSFEEVVNLPEKWSNKNNKWIVVFDEFQEINKLNGENFEKELRANIQFHKNVTYLFLGSKTHLLLNMFRDKSRAFYNIGKFFKLDKIPKKENSRFIKNNFKKFNIEISGEQIEYMLELTENIPFYVQFLSSELWQNVIATKNKIENKDIDKAVQGIISGQTDYYLELYDKLSQYQKKVLIALLEGGNEVYSKKFAEKHRLSSVSSTQRAISRLINEGILEKEQKGFQFSDPFFKRYLKSGV